ncbi:MAG TPA: DUF4293 family protein [Cytophagaceae bacterium]|nr:DUF4293 family protein [Cytophagaceae bacterium]
MIQRIQTVLLLGVVILLTVNLFVTIWTCTQAAPPLALKLNAFSVTSVPVLSSGTGKLSMEAPMQVKNVYYIAGLIVASLAVSLVTIVQYKNRKLQMLLCSVLLLLVSFILGSYFIAIPTAKSLMLTPSDGNYQIGYFLPMIDLALVLAARYYIRKDEELVKSVDRIR